MTDFPDWRQRNRAQREAELRLMSIPALWSKLEDQTPESSSFYEVLCIIQEKSEQIAANWERMQTMWSRYCDVGPVESDGVSEGCDWDSDSRIAMMDLTKKTVTYWYNPRVTP